MDTIILYLKRPIGELERSLSSAVLVVFVIFALIGDFFQFFGIDACYDGLLADLSEKYVRGCEHETSNLKHVTPFYYAINEKVGKIFYVLDFGMLLVLLSRFKFAAIGASFALSVNLSFLIFTQVYYAANFFETWLRPFVITGSIGIYFYFFIFIARERFGRRH